MKFYFSHFLSALHLLILFVPEIISDLKITQESATKVEGETFLVLCRDSNGRSVTWKDSRGQPLGMKTRPTIRSASYGTSIVFNGTRQEDQGIYTCSNGIPEQDKQFSLTVEAPLTFMDTATQQVGIEGRDVTLRCEVKGGQVTWLFDNGDIILSSAFPRYKVIGDGLLIEKVNRTDTRTYVCKAVQTSTGTMQDKKIRLTVRHKPSLPYAVYAKQEQAWAYINGTVNLTCEVEAEPPPQFEWFKKHKKINVVHGRVLNISNHISILQMIVDKKTFGDYKCVAKNELGKLEKYYSLEPGTKPYPPEFIEQRGANHDLLDIGIHPPNPPEEMPKGMEPIGYNVEYRKMEAAEWGSHDFNITEDNSYPIRNLEQDTEYEIRAATRNVAGLSDYTNISVFKTLKSEGSGIHNRDINGLVFSLAVVISACFTSW